MTSPGRFIRVDLCRGSHYFGFSRISCFIYVFFLEERAGGRRKTGGVQIKCAVEDDRYQCGKREDLTPKL